MTKKSCVWLTVACILVLRKNSKTHDQTTTKLFFLIQNVDRKLKKNRLKLEKRYSYNSLENTFIFYRRFSSAQVKRNCLIITTNSMYELLNKMPNDLKDLWKWVQLRNIFAIALKNLTKSATKFLMKHHITWFRNLNFLQIMVSLELLTL